MVVNDPVFSGGGPALGGCAKSFSPAGLSVTDGTHTDFLRQSVFHFGSGKAPRVAIRIGKFWGRTGLKIVGESIHVSLRAAKEPDFTRQRSVHENQRPASDCL